MTFPPAFWILLATGGVGFALLYYEKKNRRIEREILFFPRTILALITWVLAYAMELGLTGRSSMLLAANIQFIAIGSLPVLLLMTMRQILGRPMLRTRVFLLSGIISLTTIVLAFTDSRFGLLRNEITVVKNFGMVQLDVRYGLWHNLIFAPYQYIFYIAALRLLFDSAMKAPRIFRARLFLFALGLLVPMIGGILYIFGIPPFHVFNPTPVLTMSTLVIMAFYMAKHHRLDIVPVAHDQVLETLEEGIIVLDLDDRIVKYNAAASSMLPELRPAAVGQDIAANLGSNDALMILARGVENENAGFSLSNALVERQCLGRAIPLIGFDGRRIGRIITISDITDRASRIEPEVPEITEEERINQTRKDFYRDAAVELARSEKFGRTIHIFAFVLPKQGEGADMPAVKDLISGQLLPWERLCYAGSGYFFATVPEGGTDQALLRARGIARELIWKKIPVKIGIATRAVSRPEVVEEIATRALRAAESSRQGIAFART